MADTVEESKSQVLPTPAPAQPGILGSSVPETPNEKIAEEAEGSGAVMKVQMKQTCMQKFCRFLYNKETGAVLGRSGLSWFKIFVFYVIFYFLVFGFFAMLMVAFLQFVDVKQPRLTGKASLLSGNPGCGFRPSPVADINSDSSVIWYNRGNDKEIKFFTDQLKEIVEREKNIKDAEYVDCEIKKDGEGPKETTKLCKPYGSDTQWGGCTTKNHFGYKAGQPCVLIRLNRIILWEPFYDKKIDYKKTVAYKNLESIVESITSDKEFNIQDTGKYIWFKCEGQEWIDKQLVGNIMYYPTNRPWLSIPNTFFPYEGQNGYLSPFVMIQFVDLTPGVLTQIRCTAYNENIEVHAREGLGTVRFEIFVDGQRQQESSP